MENKRGFSLIELLIVVAIILIIAAIAIPSLVKAKISANEASAVNSVRSITTAQISYKISHDTYSPDLDTLGPGKENILPATIANAPYQHSGYTFSTAGDTSTFVVDGVPIDPGTSGIRSFCSDTPAMVFYALEGDKCVPGTSPTI